MPTRVHYCATHDGCGKSAVYKSELGPDGWSHGGLVARCGSEQDALDLARRLNEAVQEGED